MGIGNNNYLEGGKINKERKRSGLKSASSDDVSQKIQNKKISESAARRRS